MEETLKRLAKIEKILITEMLRLKRSEREEILNKLRKELVFTIEKKGENKILAMVAKYLLGILNIREAETSEPTRRRRLLSLCAG